MLEEINKLNTENSESEENNNNEEEKIPTPELTTQKKETFFTKIKSFFTDLFNKIKNYFKNLFTINIFPNYLQFHSYFENQH